MTRLYQDRDAVERAASLSEGALIVQLASARKQRVTTCKRYHSIELETGMIVAGNLVEVRLDDGHTRGEIPAEKLVQLHGSERKYVDCNLSVIAFSIIHCWLEHRARELTCDCHCRDGNLGQVICCP